ncbi:MAG: hypothetical protein R3E42_20095 [Burkholderiaceae bacterium]
MPPGHTYTLSDLSERSLKVLAHRKRHRLRAGESAAGASPQRLGTRRRRTDRQRPPGGFDRATYTAWLQRLREVCTQRGIALIFDEVFVGFRSPQVVPSRTLACKPTW